MSGADVLPAIVPAPPGTAVADRDIATPAVPDPQDAVGLCLAGEISPQVALSRLLLGGADAGALAEAVGARRPDGADARWEALAGLLEGHGAMLARLAGEVGRTGGNHAAIGSPHDGPRDDLRGGPQDGPRGAGAARTDGEATAAGIAAFFDNAVAFSPEASVALYSLGDPAILARATAEIVDWLHGHGCVGAARDEGGRDEAGRDEAGRDESGDDESRDDESGDVGGAGVGGAGGGTAGGGAAGPDAHGSGAPPGADVLDLGCGIGRLAMALAPRCRSVLGLDVSAGMVAEARRRCARLPGVRIEATPGTDLDALPGRAFDLVLAVDSMPYLVQIGPHALATHVEGAARILRPGGRLAILNLSFGRPLAQDVAELSGLAVRHGFAVEVAGGRPFALWDARAFLLRRDSAPGAAPSPDAPSPDATSPDAVPPGATPADATP